MGVSAACAFSARSANRNFNFRVPVLHIDQLNSLSPREAEAELLKCCSSKKWAWSMTAQRPFADVDQLLDKADNIWWSLDPKYWLEAFVSHPKIGEQKAAVTTSTAATRFSEQEQAGTRDATPAVMQALAAGNLE